MKFETATSLFFESLVLIDCKKNRAKSKLNIAIFLANDLTYNESELARLKPGPGEPAGSKCGLRPKQMEYIRSLQLIYFELYN